MRYIAWCEVPYLRSVLLFLPLLDLCYLHPHSQAHAPSLPPTISKCGKHVCHPFYKTSASTDHTKSEKVDRAIAHFFFSICLCVWVDIILAFPPPQTNKQNTHTFGPSSHTIRHTSHISEEGRRRGGFSVRRRQLIFRIIIFPQGMSLFIFINVTHFRSTFMQRLQAK